PFNVHDDLRIGGGEPCGRRVPVTEPDADRVRRNRQVSFWTLHGRRKRDSMVRTVVNCLAEKGRRDLFGCHYLRQGRSSVVLTAATELSVVTASGSVPCKPLMLAVGDDDRAI